MAQIAIVGGHGKIALNLIRILDASGHDARALVRNVAYRAELENLGATMGLLDIENSSEQDFADAFAGSDAVVFAAGGGGDGDIDRKQSVDFGGSLKSIAGARIAGISRMIQISAISVDKPVGEDVEEVWKAYVQAKRDADTALRNSGLDWTIIRPGGLTDEEATGRIHLAEEVDRAQIPRGDVAALIAACLEDERTIGRQWEVISGKTPITEAITEAITGAL